MCRWVGPLSKRSSSNNCCLLKNRKSWFKYQEPKHLACVSRTTTIVLTELLASLLPCVTLIILTITFTTCLLYFMYSHVNQWSLRKWMGKRFCKPVLYSAAEKVSERTLPNLLHVGTGLLDKWNVLHWKYLGHHLMGLWVNDSKTLLLRDCWTAQYL